MANTTHSVPAEATAQKLLDFVRKVVEDNRKLRYTGCVSIRLDFKDGGLRSCEQQVNNLICLE